MQTCANPVAMGTTAANGSVLLSLPAAKSGINGFLELSEASYVTTLSFVNNADNTSFFTFGATAITLVSKTAFTQLVGAVGATADPARGHLAFFTKDCSGSRAGGVNVTASNTDAQSTAAYFIGAIPSKTATQTDLSATGYVSQRPDRSGNGDRQIRNDANGFPDRPCPSGRSDDIQCYADSLSFRVVCVQTLHTASKVCTSAGQTLLELHIGSNGISDCCFLVG
jgi:hypothetical protein